MSTSTIIPDKSSDYKHIVTLHQKKKHPTLPSLINELPVEDLHRSSYIFN